MKRRAFIALATTGVVTAALPGTVFAQAAKPILIGVHLDQAKQASYYSLLQKDAIDLFVRLQNANGGIDGRPIQILYEDDENDPVVTATKVDKFAAADVSFIVSIGSSATGLATQTRASELKIAHGAPANLAERLTTEPPKPYYFRIPLRGRYELQAVAHI